MKVMISAFVVALVLAFVAPVILNQFEWSSAELNSSEQVRLD